jgi:hypothetical protein
MMNPHDHHGRDTRVASGLMGFWRRSTPKSAASNHLVSGVRV